jgi:hypothetical protein
MDKMDRKADEGILRRSTPLNFQFLGKNSGDQHKGQLIECRRISSSSRNERVRIKSSPHTAGGADGSSNFFQIYGKN